MGHRTTSEEVSDDYLTTLEDVKKQYRQYLEVSELYELPTKRNEQSVQYRDPSPEFPLTTNRIRTK